MTALIYLFTGYLANSTSRQGNITKGGNRKRGQARKEKKGGVSKGEGEEEEEVEEGKEQLEYFNMQVLHARPALRP